MDFYNPDKIHSYVLFYVHMGDLCSFYTNGIMNKNFVIGGIFFFHLSKQVSNIIHAYRIRIQIQI